MNKVLITLVVYLMVVGGLLVSSGSSNLSIISNEQMRSISGGASTEDCEGIYDGCAGVCDSSCVSRKTATYCTTGYAYESSGATCDKCGGGDAGTCSSGSQTNYCCKKYACKWNAVASTCGTKTYHGTSYNLLCGDTCN
jgi:hypothetical protein